MVSHSELLIVAKYAAMASKAKTELVREFAARRGKAWLARWTKRNAL